MRWIDDIVVQSIVRRTISISTKAGSTQGNGLLLDTNSKMSKFR